VPLCRSRVDAVELPTRPPIHVLVIHEDHHSVRHGDLLRPKKSPPVPEDDGEECTSKYTYKNDRQLM